jgi:hypothetical protein
MRTTEQLKDSGGLAAIAKMLREQQQQQQQQQQQRRQGEEEKAHLLRETNEPPSLLASSSSPRKKEKRRRRARSSSSIDEEEENEREMKKRKKREKGEKKEKKKKRKEAEKDGDSPPPPQKEKKKIRELMDLLARADAFSPDAGFAKKDKTVKRMRAKLKTMLDENVLYFSKQASGIAKNASVTAERVHAWRRAVRGEDATEEEEDGDDDDNSGSRRERKNELDSILLALKAMSDVLMAIVSDHSNEESKIEEKFSPFALQLRALSMKAF